MPKKQAATKGASDAKSAAAAAAAAANAAAAEAAALAAEQKLPNREQNMFKQLVKFFETKEYKKAVRAADQILKKAPRNGETLAMKGLTLSSMGKKDEGFGLIKEGLRYNISSHVCWHVYGLHHRSERNYKEAIKCYLNALRIDRENLQILKDLSLLQLQMRREDGMLMGFSESRLKILLLRSNNRTNWLAYAISNQLVGNYAKCLQILKTYETAVADSKEEGKYERSEFLLYRNKVLEEQGDLKQATENLAQIESEVVDKIGLWEQKVNLALKTGDNQVAEEVLLRLLSINPDNTNYHHSLRQARGLLPAADGSLTEEQIEQLEKFYTEFAAANTFSAAAQRLPLDYAQGDLFVRRVDAYLRKRIRKGIPSLFRDVRPLYADVAKAEAIETLVLQYLRNLKASSKFGDTDADNAEGPSCLVWAYLFAAQHFDYYRRDTARALELIDAAIEHTPTAIDLYVAKGRIYKHAGDMESAYQMLEQARSMDLADRYLNTECVKYALAADKIAVAEKTAALFLKDGDSTISLYDMQAMWFENALADSYFRQGLLGYALKNYLSVLKHFEDMYEDQFDFHQYCLRKTTLRAYVDTLRWADGFRNHRAYLHAASGVVKTYMRLFDDPNAMEYKEWEEEKQRRAAFRKAAQAAKEKKKKEEGKKKPEDNDPFGDKLLVVENPLAEATKHLKGLQMYCPTSIDTYLLAIELYLRKQKFLLVFQAIKRALAIEPHNAKLKQLSANFFSLLDSKRDQLPEVLVSVFDAQRQLPEIVQLSVAA
eukprot:TRINITY_DN1085_c0_g1_i2.p1 TRINITY_DN1085_c0_g1~~TRINITY_DN1085_c0_g1_i2.p1  ORF type:complete len:771 (+),score=295.90 TRINITY_DN1085_c0_g1_i2:64-2376(+)